MRSTSRLAILGTMFIAVSKFVAAHPAAMPHVHVADDASASINLWLALPIMIGVAIGATLMVKDALVSVRVQDDRSNRR